MRKLANLMVRQKRLHVKLLQKGDDMNDFQKKLAEFKGKEAAGKARANEFGKGLPIGNYLGKLQSLSAGKGRNSNRLQVHRELLVMEGEHANEVSHDWMGLEHEVAISIMTRYIEAHGMAMPAIIDEDHSAQEGDFVFAQDFLDTLQNIMDGAPTYRFRVRQAGEFKNVDVLEITDMGTLQASAEEPIAEGTVEETGTEEPVSEEENLRLRALEFCGTIGISVSDQSDIDAIKTELSQCGFPVEGVTAAQLKDLGYPSDDGVRYSVEQLEIIEELGMENTIIKPIAKAVPMKKAAPPAKAPVKAPAKAPAKAPVKAPAKKR
jgi:hypothetical protein